MLCRVLLLWMALVPIAHGAAGRWSSQGPYGGRVDSAIVAPMEPGVLYATAHRGVYRSIDNGASWTAASAGLTTLDAGNVVIKAHPTIPRRLFLAGARGVFFSADGGRSWERRDTGLPVASSSFRSVDIAFVPQDTNKLYLATREHGLYRSSDGGLSWSSSGGSTLPTSLHRVAADPNNLGRVLVWATERNTVTFPRSLYSSLDFGVNFTGIGGPWDSGGPIDDKIEFLAFNGNIANSIFLGGAIGSFRSINNLPFTDLASQLVSTSQRLQSLAADPTTPGRVVFGTSGGVLITLDNGGTFAPRNTGLNVAGGDPASIGQVLIDPANANRWLAFSVSGDVFVTANAGFNWAASSLGLRGTTVQALAVQPLRPQRVLAGIRNERSEATSPALYTSDDFGNSWVRGNANLLLDSVNGITHDPANAANPGNMRVYALGADFAPLGLPQTSYRGGVFVSNDSGFNWSAADILTPPLVGGPSRLGFVHQLIVDPSSAVSNISQLLYMVNDGRVSCPSITPVLDVPRVWRSGNAASSWSPIDNLPLGTCSPRAQYPRPYHAAFDPSATTRVFVGTRIVGYCKDCGDPTPTIPNGVFRTGNGGASWVAVNSGLPQIGGSGSTYDVTAMVAVPGSSGTLFVALDDPSSDTAPGLIYKTTDGGNSWSESGNGVIGGIVRSLRVDPQNTTRILAGVAGDETSPGAVYVSEDSGASWLSVSIDLPVDSAGAVAISRPGTLPPVFHAGTEEGVFSITRVPDGDEDGPTDANENAAPNGGDGNGDMVLDRLQRDVASVETTLGAVIEGGKTTQGTMTDIQLLRGGSCDQLVDAQFVAPGVLPSDPLFAALPTPMRFEYLNCTGTGVRLFFHGQDFSGSQWVLRRYGPTQVGNPLSIAWQTVGGVEFIGNRVEFSLVDNGPGDLRREAGRILFIGVPARIDDVFADGFE